MSSDAGGRDDWSLPLAERPPPGEFDLVVDVEGYEGPLDLLLALARSQKLDLARISILALAEQYLAFIAEARRLRLELAADYLVMAAWLAYLKSRLLVPAVASDDEPSGEMLAAELAFRLKRLEAMRDAAGKLAARARLGRDVFPRGEVEPIVVDRRTAWIATLYDLLSAYAAQKQRTMVSRVSVGRRTVWSLADARAALERMIGRAAGWVSIDDLLIEFAVPPEDRATVKASTFSASLELAKEGGLELRQSAAFAPIFIRPRASGEGADAESEEDGTADE